MRNTASLILRGIFLAGLAACGASPASPGDSGVPAPDGSAGDQSLPVDQAGQVDQAPPMPQSDADNSSSDLPAPGDVGPTPDADGKGVTVAGSGFSAQAGRAVNAAVADDKGAVLARATGTVTAGGTFEVVVSTMLTAGRSYNVAYYVDANGNGFCNAPKVDVSGLSPLAAAGPGARVTVQASAAPAPVCSYFGDFSYNFDAKQGLVEGHPGHNAYGIIADLADHTVVGELKYGLVDPAGELVLKWPTIMVKGHRYNFVLWTDDNGDGMCAADKKFVYQATAHTTGADATNHSDLNVTADPVMADINETFPYHHETAQYAASFCQMYFPNAKYP